MPRWGDQSGANAVEFALILPVLIILVFGLISAGLLWNQQLTLTQAAREGARFGATEPASGTWEDDVVARTVSASSGMLQPAQVDADLDTAAGVVTVAVEKPGTLEIVMLPAWEITLTAESIARHEEGED